MTAEFTAIDLTGDTPAEICQACAQHALLHEPTQTTIVYCTHGLRGAYRVLDRPWKVLAGIEADVFRDVVVRGLTAGELRVEARRAVATLAQAHAAQNATKH